MGHTANKMIQKANKVVEKSPQESSVSFDVPKGALKSLFTADGGDVSKQGALDTNKITSLDSEVPALSLAGGGGSATGTNVGDTSSTNSNSVVYASTRDITAKPYPTETKSNNFMYLVGGIVALTLFIHYKKGR